jgi:hypothetical protein
MENLSLSIAPLNNNNNININNSNCALKVSDKASNNNRRLVKNEKKHRIKQRKAQQKSSVCITIDTSSSEDGDSIIHVETEPVPLISIIDSSSDEEKMMNQKRRPMSPSTSSMISDDFIVSGDKLRMFHQFINNDEYNTANNNDITPPPKSKRQVSCLNETTSNEQKSLDSVKNSSIVVLSDNEEDSVYATKMMKNDPKRKKTDSVDITIKDSCNKSQKNRKNFNHEWEEEDGQENDKDTRLQMIASLKRNSKNNDKKRKRFITPNYNEEDFASMISNVINDSTNDDEISENLIRIEEKREQKESRSKMEESYFYEDKCVIENSASDSEDSIKRVNQKDLIQCDIKLNVKQNAHVEKCITSNNPKIISHTKRSNDELDCEIGWNDEMKYYYNQCTEMDFCITSIRNAMPSDPNLWRISNTDRVRSFTEHDKRFRCRNCNERGHIAANCKRPRKKIVCFMCGEQGHRETRCPNAICLRVR